MKNYRFTTLLTCLALAALPAATFAQSILIDFGAITTAGNWNNVGFNENPANLIDTNGNLTGIGLTQVGFNGPSTTGSTLGLGDWPATATQDFLYGQGGSDFANSKITFSGLDVNTLYTFEVFASRMAGGDRTGEYEFIGLNTEVTEFNAANNTTETFIVADIQPAVDGTILLSMQHAKDVPVLGDFFYVNAMEISASPIPEPSTYAALSGLGILAFAIYRRRKQNQVS